MNIDNTKGVKYQHVPDARLSPAQQENAVIIKEIVSIKNQPLETIKVAQMAAKVNRNLGSSAITTRLLMDCLRNPQDYQGNQESSSKIMQGGITSSGETRLKEMGIEIIKSGNEFI